MVSRSRKKSRGLQIIIPIIISLVIIGIFAILLPGKNIAVLNPQGIIGDKEKALLLFTTGLGLLVVIPVLIMLFSFAWRYREGNPKTQRHDPDEDGNRRIELLWWGIPILIIAVLGVITWFSSHDLDPYNPIASKTKPITIQVVALQWKWLFIYPTQGIATIGEVRFPAKTPVNFEITADAPMSAFWIPSLGSQIYAMNGMTSQLKLEANGNGSYRGENTNINGVGYATMTFTAMSMTNAEFNQWVKNITNTAPQLNWSTYTNLTKPSLKNPVTYYKLNDQNVFTQVLSKYLPSNDSMGGMNMSGMNMSGGN